MKYRLSILLLAVAITANIGFAAPKIKPQPAPKPSAKPAKGSTPSAKSVVHITPATRNSTKAKTEVTLAQNGKALMPIIISEQASAQTKAVAADMADILKRMTDATFEVKAGDGKSGIVLGNINEFPTPALDEALKIYNGYDGKEAYAIRTGAKGVLLLGATDLGANHAAYRFLHEMGCRWFFPAKVWEIIPEIKTLKFARDITDRPQILSRNMWFQAGSGGHEAEEDYRMWKLRNGHAQSLHVMIGGGGMNAPFDGTQTTHPEYWAARKQADGTLVRNPGGWQMELANPEVRKILVKYALDYFKANPNSDMVNLEPADTTEHSESPESLAMGSVSDRVFGMANEVAKAVEKAYPGQQKMVGLLSYNSYWDPPSFKLEPNVHVQTSWIPAGGKKYSFEERDRIWPTLSSNRGVYEYYGVFAWSHDKLESSFSGVEKIHRGLKAKIANGVIALQAESTANWGPNGRGYYIANKAMWNPDQSLDSLLEDFYTKAFGPAAPAMKKYYDTTDRDSYRYFSRYVIGAAFRHMDEATRLAKDRPDVLARLDFIKKYLYQLHLNSLQHSNPKEIDGVAVDPGALSAANYYRTHKDAILTFNMASQAWWPNKDWSGAEYQKPYTHEEVEKNFQAGLKFFPTRAPSTEKPVVFSTDLVPIVWDIDPKYPKIEKVLRRQVYQGAMKYALYSVKGEPLEFITIAGDAWGNKTTYKVTDAKGKVIASGNPETKVPINHKIEVPAAGLYFLDYDDSGAYWEFTPTANTIYSICVAPEVVGARTAELMQHMYFYVPKGVKKVEYFFGTTNDQIPMGWHDLWTLDGKKQEGAYYLNEYVSIPVPPGMDGQPWQIQWPSMGRFYFDNIPSYFAPTPDSLLVPREVALKDGLKIRE